MKSQDTRAHAGGKPSLLRTTAGRIVVLGSVLQLPLAALLAAKAYRAFPSDASQEMLGFAFIHLATVAALYGCWLHYGEHLRFRNSFVQNLLLVLVAVAPMVVSYGGLTAA